MTITVAPTAQILEGLITDPEFTHCYLTNARKMLYDLPVLKVRVASCQLELEAPEGRVSAVCTESDWKLTFRDRKGLYEAEILSIEECAGHLLFSLGAELSFLPRRKNIRFKMGGRNPTRVSLVHAGETCVGFLADLSMEGMSVVVDESHGFEVGHVVGRVSFELRASAVELSEMHITQVSMTDDGHPGINFCFKELPEPEAARVRHAYHGWYLAQRPSLSNRLEA